MRHALTIVALLCCIAATAQPFNTVDTSDYTNIAVAYKYALQEYTDGSTQQHYLLCYKYNNEDSAYLQFDRCLVFRAYATVRVYQNMCWYPPNDVLLLATLYGAEYIYSPWQGCTVYNNNQKYVAIAIKKFYECGQVRRCEPLFIR